MTEKPKNPFRVKIEDSIRVHLVVGGFPPGNHAGHDMDFARLQLLQRLGEFGSVRTSVSGDFRVGFRF